MAESMRQAMPTVAAWIDDLRTAFGKDCIDAQIRRGMQGEAVFYAEENGHSVGTPRKPWKGREVSLRDCILPEKRKQAK